MFISDYNEPCTVWISLQVDTASCKGVWSADNLAAGGIHVLGSDVSEHNPATVCDGVVLGDLHLAMQWNHTSTELG